MKNVTALLILAVTTSRAIMADTLPTADISDKHERHVVITAGTEKIYQGHADTVLLPDGKTMFCVWSLNHGWGEPFLKRSNDAGKTWEGVAIPENWRISWLPMIHHLVGPDRKGRLFIWDRGKDNRMMQSISEDGGNTWSPMQENGLTGCIEPSMNVIAYDGGKKHLMWFTDWNPSVNQAVSTDGGLTWKQQSNVIDTRDFPGVKMIEPGVIRSPDGKQLLMLIRDFAKGGKYNSLYAVSDDEGTTWSRPKRLPATLTGDRHSPIYAPDGRLVVLMRDKLPPNHSPTSGHFIAWVGQYADILAGKLGQYRVKLLHSHAGWDNAYPSVHLLPNGDFFAATYIKYQAGPRRHSTVSTRLNLNEIDRMIERNSSILSVKHGQQDIVPREAYFLLDPRLISRVDNGVLKLGVVKKHRGNPLFREDLPWETQLSHMYASVIFDREEKTYKCWYYSHIRGWGKYVKPGPLAAEEQNGRGNCATLYATSKGGIHWEKPKLKAYLYKGKPTNIVNWRDHGVGVFKDPRDPNPERRYKMFCTGRAPGGRVHVAFSPDGIRWTKLIDTKISTSADTHNNAFWDPLAQEYVGITRAFSHGKMGYDLKGGIPWIGGFVIGQRVVARSTSRDFLKWSAPEIVFEYGHDKRQVYAMPSFYTHGVFLGLPVIYDNAGAYREDLAKEKGWSRKEVTPELEDELKNASRTDRMWPGLSWSPDNKDWRWVGQRGEALIPLSEDRKSIEWGCIFAANAPIVLDDEIRIYYSAQPGKHGWNPGHLCLATLRLDGWAGYEPKDDSKEAVVETQPIVCNGKTLSLAADAQDGSIAVTVKDATGNTLAESKPLTGSKPYTTVKWKNGFTLSAHKGQTIRLGFRIKQAKLYSFKFGDPFPVS